MADKFPRKAALCFNAPSELAIHEAIQKVEELGADVRLTEAVILLAKAKELVSEYIDERVSV